MDVSVTTDELLAEQLAALINAAYGVGEAGLWLEGTTRTTPAEVAELIRGGGVLVARRDGQIAGCAVVKPLDDEVVDLGFISAPPKNWGSGAGRALALAAEDWARARGAREMQLELLVPCEGIHPHKQQLRAWYERLGYTVTRTAPFEEVASHLASDLAGPAEFLIFRKALSRP
jgi:GNAT superfamily N-acetyltransferase